MYILLTLYVLLTSLSLIQSSYTAGVEKFMDQTKTKGK